MRIPIIGVPLLAVLAGCSSSSSPCSPKSGQVLCGFCGPDSGASDSANYNQCVYCPSGDTCSPDLCAGACEAKGPGGTACTYDGTYNGVLDLLAAGDSSPTEGPISLTVSGCQITPGGPVSGTIDNNGGFTGTYACTDTVSVDLAGTFSTGNPFTLDGDNSQCGEVQLVGLTDAN